MNEQELLQTGLRESMLATGIAGELAKQAKEKPEGLPLLEVRKSLQYWRTHLQAGLCAVMALEAIAKGKS